MAAKKHVRQTARVLLNASMENGTVSPERVTGVLAWVEKTQPSQALAILREYHRMVRIEVNKSNARIEHAGAIGPDAVASIAASMSKLYGRAVTATASENPSLIAGIRVSIGDDVYESSITGQLESLSATA
jgi:F-type H+-transporting ATPase subunit delta